jgi:hypothetical protein
MIGMNELLSKLSSYNIFNYLVPGALFVIGAKKLGIADLTDPDLATNLLTFYVLGMIISRLGSLVIEPVMKKMKLIVYSPYADFVLASQKDLKIETLVEVSNTYRTLGSAFLLLLAGYVLAGLPAGDTLPLGWKTILMLVGLAVMFLASYCKQNEYVRKRVQTLTCLRPPEVQGS